ncbi:peptidoglycan-binding protein [Lentzea tibetensis]|uniref:Peptidoglycan-binding protein n=1 Tax=Lentzea tibetensis TaxID=2591470 RepID=A0A563ESQ2_9PSEU|nr:peptidoglycan-binding protein [Lentzea tibetensis]TWP50558.1 peptidoglycan-binding protein [Lentzea tibetensis]
MTSTLTRSLLASLLLATGIAFPVAPASAAASCTSFTSSDAWPDGIPGLYHHVPSAGPETRNFNCVLGVGNNSLAVLALQESLFVCYKQNIRRDRDFGGATKTAVENAQKTINRVHPEARLAVDGVYGPRTSLYLQFQQYDHNNGGAHTGRCSRRF